MQSLRVQYLINAPEGFSRVVLEHKVMNTSSVHHLLPLSASAHICLNRTLYFLARHRIAVLLSLCPEPIQLRPSSLAASKCRIIRCGQAGSCGPSLPRGLASDQWWVHCPKWIPFSVFTPFSVFIPFRQNIRSSSTAWHLSCLLHGPAAL